MNPKILCADCVWWEKLEGGFETPRGECRYDTPRATTERDDTMTIGIWPVTRATDWCSEACVE